jgi:hypothetical protein
MMASLLIQIGVRVCTCRMPKRRLVQLSRAIARLQSGKHLARIDEFFFSNGDAIEHRRDRFVKPAFYAECEFHLSGLALVRRNLRSAFTIGMAGIGPAMTILCEWNVH